MAGIMIGNHHWDALAELYLALLNKAINILHIVEDFKLGAYLGV